MTALLQNFREQIYALLRIVTGFLFLFHGTQKLLDWPMLAREGTPAWIQYGAGGIELIGGALVMIGLFTRWSAFVASGCMAVAYWLAHGSQALLPIMNGGDLAVLYCFVFLYIAAEGSGIWSVDGVRGVQ
jgi:putative oxidoreductase